MTKFLAFALLILIGLQDQATDLDYLNDWRFDEVISDPSFQSEIEMTQDQRSTLLSRINRLQSDMVNRVRNGDKSDPNVNLHVAQKAFIAQVAAEMNAVLLPAQIERAKQVLLWGKLNKRGIQALVEFGPVEAKLDISAEKKADLIRSSRDFEKEFQAKVREMQGQYRNRALKILGDENSAIIKEMGGESSFIEMPKAKF